MGIVNCQIHGRQGFYEVCEHIWKNLENGFISEIKEVPFFHTKICDKCYVNNNVEALGDVNLEDILKMPEGEQNQLEQKAGEIYANLKRKIKCIECFNEIKLIDAKRTKNVLPFYPYENTLMYKDKKIIEELNKVLTSNYPFQNFKNPHIKSLKAFYLKGGGITYPFSITFYYVTIKKEQLKLLKLIDNFFEKIPKKQRKISFYEAENWIKEEMRNGTHEYKGDERLLLEIIVK